MKKAVSLLLALVMAVGLVVPVWGNDLPSGTKPLFSMGRTINRNGTILTALGLARAIA